MCAKLILAVVFIAYGRGVEGPGQTCVQASVPATHGANQVTRCQQLAAALFTGSQRRDIIGRLHESGCNK